MNYIRCNLIWLNRKWDNNHISIFNRDGWIRTYETIFNFRLYQSGTILKIQSRAYDPARTIKRVRSIILYISVINRIFELRRFRFVLIDFGTEGLIINRSYLFINVKVLNETFCVGHKMCLKRKSNLSSSTTTVSNIYETDFDLSSDRLTIFTILTFKITIFTCNPLQKFFSL